MEATENIATKTEATATIGEFIRQRRSALAMSQAELGRKLGKHQVWVSQRECGQLPVGSEDVPKLAEALQADPGKLLSMTGVEERAAPTKENVVSPNSGVVTKEVVTTEILSWQVGGRSLPIDELSSEELLGAVRSLFADNARLRSDFDREMDELAEAYEQKIHSLHHVIAAHMELEIREAMRDKMDVILEVMMAEIDRRKSPGANGTPEVIGDYKEETGNGN